MRRRAKVDGNQDDIFGALRQAGWLIHSTADLGGGFPDGLGFHPGRQAWVLVEVKQPKGTLTADQKRFAAAGWPVTIVRSIDQALAL